MTGKISRLVSKKGFGFIRGEDGWDYFVHRSALRDGAAAFAHFREGQAVIFVATRREKGLCAEDVRRCRLA